MDTTPNPIAPPVESPDYAAVCDLYDLCREARMNVMYYGERLDLFQRWNLAIELGVAVGTSVTVIAILGSHSVAAAVLGVIAAVLSVAGPVLGLPKRIERVSKLWSGYNGVYVSAKREVRQVQVHRRFTAEQARSLEALHDQIDSLATDDDPAPKGSVLSRLQSLVNTEDPADRLWHPTSPAAAAMAPAA